MTIGEAYEEFFFDIQKSVISFCQDSDLAEDATQQAFSKAIVSLTQPNAMPQAALKAWLQVTARNAAIDMLRKRRRLAYDIDLQTFAAPYDNLDPLIFESYIANLSPTQQSIVRMRYLSGYTSAAIAQALGLTASNVRYHLMQAIHALRQQFKEE